MPDDRAFCRPAAIYARVSTEEQARWSIDAQVEMCKSWAASIGLCPPEAKIYLDVASGADLNRPGIIRLLADRASFGDLVVYRLDRLARSVHDWCHLVEALHGPRNLISPTIYFTSQAVDLSRPDGRAMAFMCATFAELERETIRQRTSDALARRRGGKGYDFIKPLLKELAEAGKSLREIAEAAGLALGRHVAHSTIRYLLKSLE